MGRGNDNLTALPSTVSSAAAALIYTANQVDGLIIVHDADDNIVWVNDRQREIMPFTSYEGLSFRRLFWRALEAGQVGNPLARSRPAEWLEWTCLERQTTPLLQAVRTYPQGAMALLNRRLDDGSSIQIRYQVDAAVPTETADLLAATSSARAELAALRHAIDRIEPALAILDATGAVMERNAAMIELVHQADILVDGDRGLAPCSAAGVAIWTRAIAAAGIAPTPRTVVLPDAGGRPAAAATFSTGAGPGSVIVVIARLQPGRVDHAAALAQEGLGISPVEAQVMAYLSAGYDAQEIAAAMGMTPNHARNRIARAKQQLGRVNIVADSQAAIISLMLRLSSTARAPQGRITRESET